MPGNLTQRKPLKCNCKAQCEVPIMLLLHETNGVGALPISPVSEGIQSVAICADGATPHGYTGIGSVNKCCHNLKLVTVIQSESAASRLLSNDTIITLIYRHASRLQACPNLDL